MAATATGPGASAAPKGEKTVYIRFAAWRGPAGNIHVTGPFEDFGHTYVKPGGSIPLTFEQLDEVLQRFDR